MRKALCFTRSLPGRHARAPPDCNGWAWLCSPVVLREPPSKRKSSGHRRCHGAWGGRTTHQEKLRMSLVNVKLGVEKQVNKGKRPRKPNTPIKKGNLIKESMCSM